MYITEIISSNRWWLERLFINSRLYHEIFTDKPTVTVKPQSSVFTGDTVTLRCDVGRSTGRKIIWLKDFKRLENWWWMTKNTEKCESLWWRKLFVYFRRKDHTKPTSHADSKRYVLFLQDNLILCLLYTYENERHPSTVSRDVLN